LLSLQLQHQKLEAKQRDFCSASHGAPEHEARKLHERLNANCFAWPPTFSAKSWRPSKTICIRPIMEFTKFMLGGFMKGQAQKKVCLVAL